jgi:FAD/FMN-containing dehydrogenase
VQPRARADEPEPWSIVQKQTGADRLTIGGALAANVHGRGLTLAPIVSNVESFLLVDAEGVTRVCSRTENVDLFRGAIGGYGLLGVIAAVTLRLQRRYQIIRRVEIRDAHGLIDAFNRRIAEGCAFGDFQFATDATRDSFLRTGVFSCYQRVDADTSVLASTHQRALSPEDWRRLAYLAHVDKSRAFEMYARHYLSTEGQVYWSDTHQLAFYEPDYHAHLDQHLNAHLNSHLNTQSGVASGTEMITEIYVPRAALEAYLEDARGFLRERHADLIYGTIRLIEREDREDETLLAWAREPWACIIFNLHVTHTPVEIARGAETFRGLIDLAIAHGGSYYLTYHRWATSAQLRRCHPRFDEFVALKRRVDPESRFQSDWYRHYAEIP